MTITTATDAPTGAVYTLPSQADPVREFLLLMEQNRLIEARLDVLMQTILDDVTPEQAREVEVCMRRLLSVRLPASGLRGRGSRQRGFLFTGGRDHG